MKLQLDWTQSLCYTEIISRGPVAANAMLVSILLISNYKIYLPLDSNNSEIIEHRRGFRSVVVITSALHAEGRQFEPGRNQDYFVETGLKT